MATTSTCVKPAAPFPYTHVIELLEKIHAKPPGEEIVLHLDNARYQHARKLKEWIAQQQNEGVTFVLGALPALLAQSEFDRTAVEVCPQTCSADLARHFEAMQEAIAKVLNNLADYADELRTLMTEKFHIRPAA